MEWQVVVPSAGGLTPDEAWARDDDDVVFVVSVSVSVSVSSVAAAGLNFLFCHEMNRLHAALYLISEQVIYVFCLLRDCPALLFVLHSSSILALCASRLRSGLTLFTRSPEGSLFCFSQFSRIIFLHRCRGNASLNVYSLSVTFCQNDQAVGILKINYMSLVVGTLSRVTSLCIWKPSSTISVNYEAEAFHNGWQPNEPRRRLHSSTFC